MTYSKESKRISEAEELERFVREPPQLHKIGYPIPKITKDKYIRKEGYAR